MQNDNQWVLEDAFVKRLDQELRNRGIFMLFPWREATKGVQAFRDSLPKLVKDEEYQRVCRLYEQLVEQHDAIREALDIDFTEKDTLEAVKIDHAEALNWHYICGYLGLCNDDVTTDQATAAIRKIRNERHAAQEECLALRTKVAELQAELDRHGVQPSGIPPLPEWDNRPVHALVVSGDEDRTEEVAGYYGGEAVSAAEAHKLIATGCPVRCRPHEWNSFHTRFPASKYQPVEMPKEREDGRNIVLHEIQDRTEDNAGFASCGHLGYPPQKDLSAAEIWKCIRDGDGMSISTQEDWDDFTKNFPAWKYGGAK